MAQIDAGIQFKKISPDRKVGYKQLTPEEAAAFADRGEAGAGNRNIFQRTLLNPSFGPAGGAGIFAGDAAGRSTILTPGGGVDAETYVGQTADDVMGSLEGGPSAVKDAATGQATAAVKQGGTGDSTDTPGAPLTYGNQVEVQGPE